MTTKLIFVVLLSGVELVGEVSAEVAERASSAPSFELTKARRIDLIQLPQQTPQGIVMLKQVDLLPVALSSVMTQSVDIMYEDILLMGEPDQQMTNHYMRVVYRIEPATPGQVQSLIQTP